MVDPDKSKVTKLITDYGVRQHIYSEGGLRRLAFYDRAGYYPRQIDGKSVAWPHGDWKREVTKPEPKFEEYCNGQKKLPLLGCPETYEVDWKKFNEIGIKETIKPWATTTEYKRIQTTFLFHNLPPGLFPRVVIAAFEGCFVTTFTNAVGQPLPQWVVTRGPPRGGILLNLNKDASNNNEKKEPPDYKKGREAAERKRRAYLEKLNNLNKEQLEEKEKSFAFWLERGKEDHFVCYQDELGDDVCFGEVRESDNPGNEMFVYLEDSCVILSTLRMPPSMVADVAKKAPFEAAKDPWKKTVEVAEKAVKRANMLILKAAENAPAVKTEAEKKAFEGATKEATDAQKTALKAKTAAEKAANSKLEEDKKEANVAIEKARKEGEKAERTVVGAIRMVAEAAQAAAELAKKKAAEAAKKEGNKDNES